MAVSVNFRKRGNTPEPEPQPVFLEPSAELGRIIVESIQAYEASQAETPEEAEE